MVKYVVTDTAHDRTSYTAHTARTHHDHRHCVVLRHPTDHLTRLAAAALRLDETAYLHHTNI